MTSVGIDCSQLAAIHAFQQENMRVGKAMIECGLAHWPEHPEFSSEESEESPSSPNILVSNRTCSSGSSCTRSESFVWRSARAGDQTVVVNYNDQNGSGFGGISTSTDGGATFTQLIPFPLTGHGTNFGDPLVIFNLKQNKWYAGDLASGCGGQGIGVWTSPDGLTWTTGACAANGGSLDRPSMWVDNNPFSRAYGRMYIEYTNFNIGSGALIVATSDDGTTWTGHTLTTNFLRPVQLTGAPPGPPPPNVGYTSLVIAASMNEEGGGLTTRQNVIWRSIDGGNTWSQNVTGPTFAAVGDRTCTEFNPYFAVVNPIWRHMGWGQPGVGPGNIVHYVYAGAGQVSGDKGDIYYVRSADGGITWSSPIVLNDDTGGPNKTQWMPNLSVDYNLAGFSPPQDVTASWYDRRSATSSCVHVGDAGCNYERFARQSHDNGLTWDPNIAVSDQIIPQPAQNDPQIVPCYAGDYDYAFAFGTHAYITWTDGRVNVQGTQVQSVEFANVTE
jgi:hypothetical protein